MITKSIYRNYGKPNEEYLGTFHVGDDFTLKEAWAGLSKEEIMAWIKVNRCPRAWKYHQYKKQMERLP